MLEEEKERERQRQVRAGWKGTGLGVVLAWRLPSPLPAAHASCILPPCLHVGMLGGCGGLA